MTDRLRRMRSVTLRTSTGAERPTCFVIIPFRKPFNDLYDRVIAPIVCSSGFTPIRGDRIYSTGPIVDDIFKAIVNSTAVVADATGKNPNVNYELGIAHTLNKPTIIIAQSRSDIPFDYRHIRSYLYKNVEGDLALLGDSISAALRLIATEKNAKGIDSLKGRWIGWYKEPDDIDWYPTAHEVAVTADGTINVIAYGVSNQSQSICAHTDKDHHGKIRLLWSYDSKSVHGGYEIADHTGTHIAYFRPGPKNLRFMDGKYFTNRKLRDERVGGVGEFNCQWVSYSLSQGLAFDMDHWPVNRGLDL